MSEEWNYDAAHGPDHWAELNPCFSACREGHAQSPVDIHAARHTGHHSLTFNYRPIPLQPKHNGHSIQIDVPQGLTLNYDGVPYHLRQFHFHHPSEHTLDGQLFEMEMHLVHAAADGQILVVGVMLSGGAQVDAPCYAPLFDHLPTAECGPQYTGLMIDPGALLPKDHAYYYYEGSLTTPPCTEGVHWVVMAQPIPLSDAQVDAFTAVFPDNHRPVQPLYDREVYSDEG